MEKILPLKNNIEKSKSAIAEPNSTIQQAQIPFPVPSQNQNFESEPIYENLKILNRIKTDNDILLSCKYTENNMQIAAGLVNGAILLFDSNTKKMMEKFHDSKITAAITAIKCRPFNSNHPATNSLTATYTNGIIKFWNYHIKNCLCTINEKRKIFGLQYHKFLPKIITYGDNNLLYYYDEQTVIRERIFGSSNGDSTTKIYSVCFNPKNSFEFVSGGNDNKLYFWDIRLPTYFRVIKGPFIGGNSGLDITKSGNEIVTFSWRKKDQIQIWDYSTSKLINSINLDNFTSYLYCGKILHNNHIVCGGTDPNLIGLINIETKKIIAVYQNLPGGIFCLDVKDKVEPGKSLPRVIFCSDKLIYEIDFGL